MPGKSVWEFLKYLIKLLMPMQLQQYGVVRYHRKGRLIDQFSILNMSCVFSANRDRQPMASRDSLAAMFFLPVEWT